MNGEELIGPVQWILIPLKPILFWMGVSADWLKDAALNTIMLTTFTAKTFKWGGWPVVVVAAGWGALYSLAQYLPSLATALAATAACFIMTALALKAAGLLGKGANSVGEKALKPLGAGSRRIDG